MNYIGKDKKDYGYKFSKKDIEYIQKAFKEQKEKRAKKND